MANTSPLIFDYLNAANWAEHQGSPWSALNEAEALVADYPEDQKASVLAGVLFLAVNNKPNHILDKKLAKCGYLLRGGCVRADCRFAHSDAMVQAANRVFKILEARRAAKEAEDFKMDTIYRTASGNQADAATANLSQTAASCALSVID
jgi:hypothetical protein